ncbi:hypothetical protein Vretimale_17171 [Volvox reticuliferus]|uniref:Rrp15p-domain-containing protein n=1 Tax=Volvox reticuliferus TaxID=1737510 RepID=A0A8J4GSH5_9CHLO|nr:hypothetical protein Vretifemale_18577 [Volvox reticuliferus]GIM14163.1 hypothetical protein Vretimale_17171 [Volvox reticuliferus]
MGKLQKPKARVPSKQDGAAGKASAAKGRPASASRKDNDRGSPTEDSFENQDLPRSDGTGSGSSEGEDLGEDLPGAAVSGSEDEASEEDILEEDDDESEDEDGDSESEEEDLDLMPDEFGEEGDADDSDEADDIDIGGGGGGSSSSDLMADDDSADDEDEDADADDEDDGDEDGERQQARRRSGSEAGTAAAAPGTGRDGGGFLEGSKGASFAKAFNKLLKAKSKPSEGDEAPILVKSKTVAKRQAQEDADAEARRDAKRARQERRQRGHVKVPRKGEDPVHDQLEKQLGRLATKGVVMLFNAISTAQKQAGGAGSAPGAAKKPAKLSKASFLAQLRANGSDGGGVLSAAATAAKGGNGEAAAAPGWKVLQAGFSGLSGGGKMKDWDRKPSGSDEEDAKNMGVGGAGGGTSSESDGGEGW